MKRKLLKPRKKEEKRKNRNQMMISKKDKVPMLSLNQMSNNEIVKVLILIVLRLPPHPLNIRVLKKTKKRVTNYQITQKKLEPKPLWTK